MRFDLLFCGLLVFGFAIFGLGCWFIVWGFVFGGGLVAGVGGGGFALFILVGLGFVIVICF